MKIDVKTALNSYSIWCFFAGLVLSQENEIDLKKFETATGECSVSEKEAINKKAIEENFELFSSFTITDAAIDRRRGASPRPVQK